MGWQVRQQIEQDLPIGSNRKVVEQWTIMNYDWEHGLNRIVDENGNESGFMVTIPQKAFIQLGEGWYSEVRVAFYFDGNQKLSEFYVMTFTMFP
jgi:hypothetical protein